jgi:hypothetical protein
VVEERLDWPERGGDWAAFLIPTIVYSQVGFGYLDATFLP